MNTQARDLLISFFRQQSELRMPGYLLASGLPRPNIPEADGQSDTQAAGRHAKEKSTATVGNQNGKRSALAELYYSLRECTGCSLHGMRKKLVFGAGNAEAPVVIVGEAPGEEDDRKGLPFVGPAGELLTKMLVAIDLDRSKDVFITNVLKCRPPGNRNPESSEIQACNPVFQRQIEIIAPKAILLLGRVAAQEVLKTSEGVRELREKTHDYNGIPCTVTYHPSMLLRNKRFKTFAWEDLKRFREHIRQLGIYERASK